MKKKHYIILGIVLLGLLAFAPPIYRLIPFASGSSLDTAYTKGSLRVDGAVRLPLFSTADSNKVLGLGSNGLITLRTKGTGSGNNFANADLTLTGSRSHDFAGRSMIWNNVNTFEMNDGTYDGFNFNQNGTAANSFFYANTTNHIAVVRSPGTTSFFKADQSYVQATPNNGASGIIAQYFVGVLDNVAITANSQKGYYQNALTGILGLNNYTGSTYAITSNMTTGANTFNGAYTFPLVDGTVKMGLVTDGAGNLSWAYPFWPSITSTPTSISGYGITDAPTIVGHSRLVGQTVSTVFPTYGVGASDASFTISANVNVTTSSAENFTAVLAYTDETNTARVQVLPFLIIGGTSVSAITFANGAVPYEGFTVHIRAKASTNISIGTTGTFTGVTYNLERSIIKIP